ncbi:MAG: multidrug transporter [Sphingomonadales bacterium CG12_big_fil_rev_8_21_14_0_65_65_10]|uniref:Peptidase n=1 Tax=Blastomonas marina TaxID=1867408 RepID=A0ABQ1F804_9SPHN|nr:SapC family protein [Blastomonas marina]PIW54001.1 MAG: multidrug transporter [Sphingomonadales bacterium CG12_big_fil_rev_8_21_14_0_65_65_10]WPZ04483.1 SapC family protein [Blastomonas marina]GGA02124.1 peptidase [Blastomonas marina]
MASAPQNSLPLFYNDLMPLNSRDHANWKAKETDALPWLATANAIPLTIDEFPLAQRYLPIVFSSGDNPIPLGLMGLNEGVNVYVDSDGRVTGPTYVPAYVRRYPFMLTKLTPDATDLSLCFDPTSGLIGEFEEGHALFDGDKPAEAVERTLNFCEQFDQAAQRTKMAMDEFKKHDLIMDGEVSIEHNQSEQPFVYRGFGMINEEKLRELDAETVKQFNQNGLLALMHAHLFSLNMTREIFGMQVQQGKGPVSQQAATDVQADAPAAAETAKPKKKKK